MIDVVIPDCASALIPIRSTNPTDCVPIPAKIVLNLVLIFFRS